MYFLQVGVKCFMHCAQPSLQAWSFSVIFYKEHQFCCVPWNFVCFVYPLFMDVVLFYESCEKTLYVLMDMKDDYVFDTWFFLFCWYCCFELYVFKTTYILKRFCAKFDYCNQHPSCDYIGVSISS
jgi:hypothetical protein